MSINYTKLAATALRLIRDNGRNVQFRKFSRVAQDSNKPWRSDNPSAVSDDTQFEVTVKAVVTPYTQFEIDGTLIRNGDKRAYVAASAWEAACAALDVAATNILTLVGQPNDGETVTVNGKVYTFQTVLTNVDGHVLISVVDVETTLNDFIAAVMLGAGAGTAYATSTTLHPTVAAVAGAGSTVGLTAKTAGSAGNALTLANTVTGASVTGATFAGGITTARALEFYDEMSEADDQQFRIMSAGLINPADVSVLYDIHMRT